MYHFRSNFKNTLFMNVNNHEIFEIVFVGSAKKNTNCLKLYDLKP